MIDDSGTPVQQLVPEWAYRHACEVCTGSRHLFEACSRSLLTSCHYCRQSLEVAAPLGAIASVAVARLEALIDPDKKSSSGLPVKMVGDVIRENLRDANPTFCDDLVQVVGVAKSWSDLRSTQSHHWNYRRVGQEEQDKVWEDFRKSLRGKSRFFNTEARVFLDGLFSILPSLSPNGFFYANVLVDLEAGRTLFRARRANTQADVDRIKSSPARELHAPPPDTTPSNRMNVERAPAFYAAFDNKTAIAEVRPSRGSRVVVGVFKTTRRLKIFDFTSLAKNSAPYFSIWSEDFVDRSRKRGLLLRLQDRIARPIPLGLEHEYLDTQVVADYLHSCLKFDGVMFESTQEEGGKNVVLFGMTLGSYDPATRDFPHAPLAFENGSVEIHEVTGLKVSSSRVG